MRVAITLLVALAAVAGPIPAFASCSSGTGGGSSPVTEIPKAIVNPILAAVGLPPLGGTTNITNNTTNITNITNVTAAEQTGQTPSTAVALGPGGGGVGGGGGGIGGMGGGFSGSSSGGGGTPINPSDTPSVAMIASGGSSSSGGGNSSLSDPITVGTLSSTTAGGNTGNFVMMAADQSNEQPLTPGIPIAAVHTPMSGPDTSMSVAMASPRTERAATSDGIGFEGQAAAAPHAPATANTTMLAALIGVGMIGAGWAWRSLGA